MGKRLLTRADKELLGEIYLLLWPVEPRPSVTKLERWRQAGLIPETEPAGGRATRYPSGTAAQVVALMRQLACDDRRLEKAALPLFLAGHHIREKALRPVFLEGIDQLRASFEAKAAETRLARGAKPKRRLGPFEIAAALAATMREKIEVHPRADPVAQQMVQRLREPQPLTEERAEDHFEILLSHLFYVFLTGRMLPAAEPVVESLLMSTGLQDLVRQVMSQLNLDWWGEGLLTSFPEGMRVSSLPAMRRAVLRSDADQFAQARDDYRVLRDLVTYAVRALALLVGYDIAESLFGAAGVANLGAQSFIPLVLVLRSLDHYDELTCAARDVLPSLPPLEVLAAWDREQLLERLQQAFGEVGQLTEA